MSKRPRSFPKNFQPQRDWGIRYRNNSKAWMLSKDYSDWLKEWNGKLCGYVVPSKAVLMSFERFTLRTVQQSHQFCALQGELKDCIDCGQCTHTLCAQCRCS
jgi:hypothetical protein